MWNMIILFTLPSEEARLSVIGSGGLKTASSHQSPTKQSMANRMSTSTVYLYMEQNAGSPQKHGRKTTLPSVPAPACYWRTINIRGGVCRSRHSACNVGQIPSLSAISSLIQYQVVELTNIKEVTSGAFTNYPECVVNSNCYLLLYTFWIYTKSRAGFGKQIIRITTWTLSYQPQVL